jgi:hypothetical protein
MQSVATLFAEVGHGLQTSESIKYAPKKQNLFKRKDFVLQLGKYNIDLTGKYLEEWNQDDDLGRACGCGIDVSDASQRVGAWLDRTFPPDSPDRTFYLKLFISGMQYHAKQQSTGNSPDTCEQARKALNGMRWALLTSIKCILKKSISKPFDRLESYLKKKRLNLQLSYKFHIHHTEFGQIEIGRIVHILSTNR